MFEEHNLIGPYQPNLRHLCASSTYKTATLFQRTSPFYFCNYEFTLEFCGFCHDVDPVFSGLCYIVLAWERGPSAMDLSYNRGPINTRNACKAIDSDEEQWM
jgi:hypothetical protein